MPSGSMIGALRILLNAIAFRRRWQAGLVFLLMLVAGTFELLTVGAVAPFLAVVTAPGSLKGLGGVLRAAHAQDLSPRGLMAAAAGLFAACAFASAVARVALAWAQQKFVFRLGFDLEVMAYEAFLRRPYVEQVRSNSSETLSVLEKVGAVSSTVFLPILSGVSSVLIAGFILTALIAIRPLDAIIALAGFGLAYLGVSLVFRGRLGRSSHIVASAQHKRIQSLQEGLGGIRDIILEDNHRLYVDRFADIDLGLRDAQSVIGVIGAAPRFAIEGAGMIVIAGLVVWLSEQHGGVLAALPLLAALALAAQRLLPLLQQIYNSWTQVAGSRQMLFDVAALFETAPARALPQAPPAEPLAFQRSVSLDAVSFRYADRTRPALDRLSLHIDKGERIGLVGRSGGGKSTAMDVLLGLLEPESGAMRIDGVALTPATRVQWRRMVAHVPQTLYLSDASIRENIAVGVPSGGIDDERVRDAAWRCDLGPFIEALPSGYDTTVGERGVLLSGGQRQRIGIARALYKRSRVLVFDEATSALDDETEDAVLDAIAGLDRDLTVVMVAHRLRTLRACTRIYRLEDGRGVEEGAYAQFARLEA